MSETDERPAPLSDARQIVHLEAEIRRLRGMITEYQDERIRLRAALAARDEIVRAVAETSGRLGCVVGCRVNERWNETYPERWGRHSPNCLVSKARALLAATDGATEVNHE